MGILDRFRKSVPSDGPGVPEPDLSRPYATVTYRDPQTGGTVEVQAYSAVQADEIKADHPDAKITPKRGR